MDIGSAWPVPFILDPQNLAVDAVVSFVVAVLITITINAEAQAYAATLLGDNRPEAKDRFHFIAVLHLDVLGTLSYLVAGFGWPRPIKIDPTRFKHPGLYTVITRFAGPMANLMLAGIAGSIAGLMKIVEFDARVFLIVVGVNVTTAIYGLLPLPPLAAGSLIMEMIPPRHTAIRWGFQQSGPFLILAVLLLERITQQGIISPYFNPLITAVYRYIVA